ncbi:integrase, catalytic region, zinc finger, CCHC-type containing protein [Tanacetum coccineum]
MLIKRHTYADVRDQNQDLLIIISELKAKLKNIKKGKSVNTKFDKDNISHNFICVTPLNKQPFQKKIVAPKTEEKHVLLQTSPNKQQAVETNKNVIAPRMYKVKKTQNTNTNKAKTVLSSTGLRATSSVRRPSNRGSLFKHSVLSNTKNSSEKVEVFDRLNITLDVASKNVDLNKNIVTNDDIKKALIAKNVLCVSCAKNVLIPCHDNCLAKYKLNVYSKVRRALFTTSRTVKSKFEDPIPVVQRLGGDLLARDRESNLYTIFISDMAASSPVYLMSKATSTKSWLWHRRLSHLNFDTINDLTKHDLVDGLPKFKYGKDHLCSACERGKSKKASHPHKVVPSNHSKLELLHMDLCGPMRVASINGKRYILVIVDDYFGFTWIRTDNGTEFKNATLKAHYDKLGIMQQFLIARMPQQNGVVERRNRTLVEAASTMLIFSRLPEFLWAKAVSTACFT